MNYLSKNVRKIVALICAFFTIMTVAAIPSHAAEEPIDFGQLYGIVDAGSLNVRAYASETAPIVANLSNYTYVRVNWVEPGWVCVAYNNDGLIGYVSADHIKVFEGAMPETYYFPGVAAVEAAKKYLGVSYVWGGTSPSGFDCSGLVQYVYKELGYSLNRVAADQMKNGIPVAYEDLAPGDLVGFYSSPGGGYVSHIGMYVGDGMMIHAPHTGDVVRYASIGDGTYYKERFAGGRRIIY